jgi:hypothetical protein
MFRPALHSGRVGGGAVGGGGGLFQTKKELQVMRTILTVQLRTELRPFPTCKFVSVWKGAPEGR